MFSTPTPTSAADVVAPTAAEVDQYQTAFRQLAKGGSDISASRAQRFLARSQLPEADLQHVWQTAVPQKERASFRVGQASFLAVMAAVQLRVVAEMAKAAREEQAFAPAPAVAPAPAAEPAAAAAPPERDGARHDVLLAGASLHFRERSGGARGRELPLRAVRRAELVGEDTLRVWHGERAAAADECLTLRLHDRAQAVMWHESLSRLAAANDAGRASHLEPPPAIAAPPPRVEPSAPVPLEAPIARAAEERAADERARAEERARAQAAAAAAAAEEAAAGNPAAAQHQHQHQ